MQGKLAVARWLVPLLLLLGGCLGENKPASDTGGAASSAGPAGFDSDTGGIEGRVVDDEGAPVAGVQVGAFLKEAQQDHSTTTAADGGFSFSNLAPGRYQVIAQKLGFDPAAKAVDVEAGKLAQPSLILSPVAVTVAHHETVPYDGFFDCTWYYAGSSGPCGFLPTNSTTGNPLEPLWTKSKRAWNYKVGPQVMTVFNEMKWSKTSVATGDKMRIVLSHGPVRDLGHNFCVTDGKSPLVLRWEREDAKDAGSCLTGSSTAGSATGPKTIDWKKGETLRSFVSTSAGSSPSGGDIPVGVAYQQSFTLWTTVFYGEAAREGFTAMSDN